MTSELSRLDMLRMRSTEERQAEINKMTRAQKAAARYQWYEWWARPKQMPPPGDWFTWMLRAGRGFGKTKTGAGYIHARAMELPGRWIALVARTPADARDVMIQGPGGLLNHASPKEKPQFNPSNRAIIWPNGSHATIFSDEVPDQLRGYSGDTAWIDELAKFKHPQETWDSLMFGMREPSNDQPRVLVTTTPRPLAIIRQIEKDPTTVVVTGSSYENRANLSAKFFNQLQKYEGTRLGRQEIEAQIIDDLPGALWTRQMLEDCRVPKDCVPEFKRVVVGVDPSGTGGPPVAGEDTSNSVGIVAVGLGMDGNGYVLADNTCSLSPFGWGRRVISTRDAYEGDRIVAEKNFGGAMVDHVIRTHDKNAAIKLVTASRGKVARAEPVSALYEQGRVKHVGSFPELEDQMCAFLPDGYGDEGSPDRADALVWAITELMLQKKWMTDERVETGLPVVG